MEPFWADALHQCEGCGAFDVGLYPERCRCGKKTITKSKPLTFWEWLIPILLGIFAGLGFASIVFFFILNS